MISCWYACSGYDARTLPAQREVVLEGIPSGCLDLVALGEQVPGEETREVLDGAVGLRVRARRVSGRGQGTEAGDPERVRTLSRPRVVLQVLRDWETMGWKTTCAATVDMVCAVVVVVAGRREERRL